MADNLMTKVWALDFQTHRWQLPGPAGNGAPEGDLQAFTSPNVKFVALAIARASLANGACWAAQRTLATITGLSKQTVGRAVNELESAGWLKRINRHREDGGKSTDKLWLTLPEVVLAAEVVPPRPQRFFGGDVSDVDHDGPPPITVEREPLPPAGAPPIRESTQERESEGIRKKVSSVPAVGGDPTPDFESAVGLIWAKASKTGRERSSKADIEQGLRAAVGRGHSMERILRGLGAYFASHDATKDGGAFQRGAHVMLAKDRWASFLDDAQARAEAGEATPAAAAAEADMGTVDAPTAKRQRLWMELFIQGMAWDPDRGPQPGRLGCRVSDAIQREFGVEPYAPPAAADEAAFD